MGRHCLSTDPLGMCICSTRPAPYGEANSRRSLAFGCSNLPVCETPRTWMHENLPREQARSLGRPKIDERMVAGCMFNETTTQHVHR